ncbi:MAG: hypothetical protein RLZZ367_2371 [Bacteroidota bacterium]|jgi:hypothetical protein
MILEVGLRNVDLKYQYTITALTPRSGRLFVEI